MTTVADLVTALHDIDALKGGVCGTCAFNCVRSGRIGRPPRCSKGYSPSDEMDGCDDWQARPDPERKAKALAAVV